MAAGRKATKATTALALALGWAVAAPGMVAAAGSGAGDACEIELPEGSYMTQRIETIGRFERLPEACLKSLVTECSHTAEIMILDVDVAAVCSMGYEALLRKSFGGDYHAMLAWWRAERASRGRR